LIDGSLDETRRATLRADRFPDAKLDETALTRIFDAFSTGATMSSRALDTEDAHAGWELVDSADPLDWARAVDDVRSCQSTDGDPNLNCGLLNRFEDGSVRLIALRDDTGATRGRGAMRLTTLQDGQVGLLLDRLYGEDEDAQVELMTAFGRERAKALGVPLVLTDSYSKQRRYQHVLRLPATLASDYLDVGRGSVTAGFDEPLVASVHIEDAGAPLVC
jgi:hypothetical protein